MGASPTLSRKSSTVALSRTIHTKGATTCALTTNETGPHGEDAEHTSIPPTTTPIHSKTNGGVSYSAFHHPNFALQFPALSYPGARNVPNTWALSFAPPLNEVHHLFTVADDYARGNAPCRSNSESQVHTSDRRKIGPLKLLRKLPGGLFGKTYVARDCATGRIVCTRISRKGKMREDDTIFHGLLTELLCYKHIAAQEPTKKLFIMELHGALQDDDNVLFVMPLMQSDLLAELQNPIEKPRIRRWIAQIAMGLDALHNMGIIHRDIKPENILLAAPTDSVLITDFNAAYFAPENAPLETDAVYTCEFVGSKPYLSPEVANKQWYGKMVDWWALGCLMFDLIAGDLLFRSDSQRERYLSWDAKSEGASFLQREAPDLAPDEESLLLGLLQPRPRSRFQLKDLQRHRYFADNNNVNIFHALRDQALRSPCGYGNGVRQDALPQPSPALAALPLCAASAAPRATGADGAFEFRDFAWVNPHGLWGPSR